MSNCRIFARKIQHHCVRLFHTHQKSEPFKIKCHRSRGTTLTSQTGFVQVNDKVSNSVSFVLTSSHGIHADGHLEKQQKLELKHHIQVSTPSFTENRYWENMNATQNGQLDIPKSSLYSNGHIEYYPGTMNVILSVPHGGRIKPANIPDRDAGYFADDEEVYDHNRSIKKDPERLPVRKKSDRFTIELSMLIAKELQVLSGKRPHIVINHLYRGKMDANCDVGKATFNVPDAVSAWYAFHDCINSAKQSFNGRGLFLDIHGQSHPEDWVELGYTIPVESLNEGSYSVTDTSVANLIRVKNLNVEDLICGAQSLGSFIESQGYPTVPSPRVPSPGNSNIYTGGFNTITHGSKRTGSVDSIQIECPYKARLEKTGIPFAKALARSIYKFWTIYYEK